MGILIVGDNLQAVMEGRQEVGGGRSPNAEVSHTVTIIFFKGTKMLWKLPSQPKENEEENAKRRKVEVLRLGLLSSAVILQRKDPV